MMHSEQIARIKSKLSKIDGCEESVVDMWKDNTGYWVSFTCPFGIDPASFQSYSHVSISDALSYVEKSVDARLKV
jgi:hypothetical protein